MTPSMEERLNKVETDLTIFQKVHETRLDYLEKSVVRHMEDEEKNIKEIKEFLKDLDSKIVSGEQLIDNRIQRCRAEIDNRNEEKFATRTELATISGEVKTNTKIIAAWVVFVGILISVANLIMR